MDTVILNLALLFTILFFVYPLKFLFTVLLGDPMMRHAKVMTAHGLEPAILPQHRPWIYVIYGVGFIAIFALFALLYRHAYNQREKLELNEFEIWETQHALRRFLIAVALGSTYLGVAVMELIPESNGMAINAVSVLVFVAVVALKREWLAR